MSLPPNNNSPYILTDYDKLDESEYQFTTEDTIYPSHEDNDWTTVKHKQRKYPKSHTLRTPAHEELSIHQVNEDAKYKLKKKQNRKTRKQERKELLTRNKSRWVKDKPEILHGDRVRRLQLSLVEFFRNGYNKFHRFHRKI